VKLLAPLGALDERRVPLISWRKPLICIEYPSITVRGQIDGQFILERMLLKRNTGLTVYTHCRRVFVTVESKTLLRKYIHSSQCNCNDVGTDEIRLEVNYHVKFSHNVYHHLQYYNPVRV